MPDRFLEGSLRQDVAPFSLGDVDVRRVDVVGRLRRFVQWHFVRWHFVRWHFVRRHFVRRGLIFGKRRGQLNSSGIVWKDVMPTIESEIFLEFCGAELEVLGGFGRLQLQLPVQELSHLGGDRDRKPNSAGTHLDVGFDRFRIFRFFVDGFDRIVAANRKEKPIKISSFFFRPTTKNLWTSLKFVLCLSVCSFALEVWLEVVPPLRFRRQSRSFVRSQLSLHFPRNFRQKEKQKKCESTSISLPWFAGKKIGVCQIAELSLGKYCFEFLFIKMVWKGYKCYFSFEEACRINQARKPQS